jgi:type IV pilus assembly protein PilC
MESGEGLYESMLVADIFSPLNASLLSIGIRTGSLEQTLYKISDSYEEEANQKISNLISVLEPSLVIILSIIIGIIIISFLMPLIAIMSSIG